MGRVAARFHVADRAICEQATKIQDAMIICAPMISQIDRRRPRSRTTGTTRERFHREFVRRRQLVADRLAAIPKLQWTPTGGGFFAFARVSRLHRTRSALAQRLLEDAHVVTIPGAAFGHCGEGCLRLSFGSVSGEGLVEGLDRLEDYFSGA